ncbi:receptor-like protein EIX2 isoform X2 [Salvia hispanica]|uniref:receptor-like protein EIX2 isoform X2 n=1 Tax=Salvia hispanica TaxID=49212 RepID=UPI002009A5C2|nr:receptor-like protein EIX2 isoform X2 [Salvia hispanica]
MISAKRIAINFLHVVLFCVFVSGDAEVRCIDKEREALLTFKNGLIDGRGVLSSWQSNECCDWYGVECSNITSHVITLQCDYCGLQGEVRSSLLELHHLNYLDLSGNNFGGIPIPQFIGSMKQLQHLSLEDSNFHGIIPPNIGNLTNLRTLDISDNSLSSTSLSIIVSVLESLEILDLSHNQLNGSMPDLRAFSSLTELHLSGNNFSGYIPLSIGKFSKLQVLDLSLNSFEGLVPPSIGQLSNLQTLDLSFNSLEGLVSESHFSKLDKLKTLVLSFNSLILHIESDWSPPFQLESIYFGRCNVGPSFPKWIQTQMNLSVLDLRGANITDETPSWLWSSSSLLYCLFLSDNQISGHIPLFPANAIDIQFSGNKFSGSVSSICKTSHDDLIFLDISNNQLTGKVPDCWEKFPNLHSLNLASNKFSGKIPLSLGNLQNSVALQMHGNNLFGELPYNLSLCQKLLIIDVGGNKLTGEIPTWIGQMHQMQFLNLRGNILHGSIPPEICNLTNIQVLDFSINNLSSIIPDCFNNFIVLASKSTTYLDPFLFSIYFYNNNENKHYGYSSFLWKGKESGYKTNLEFLKLIDFSSNRLTGNIPKSFSNMRDLNSLNLSRNSLSGGIIPDIGKMEMLDSLDLSQNQLSGKIPTSLAEIYTLGFLDLSNNSLFGKIPTSTQLQSFNASAYAGNNGLCGDPLPECPEDSLRPSTTSSPPDNMNEKENNSFFLMQEVDISMVIGFIIGFWGVVGSFVLKKSWRDAFFHWLDVAGDWFYVKGGVLVSKFRPS